jgi:hypothetical protein
MMKKEVVMTRRFKGSILVLMIVLFTFSIVACGGGSSGDGTVSLSGIVLDPLEGSDPVPVGSALV